MSPSVLQGKRRDGDGLVVGAGYGATAEVWLGMELIGVVGGVWKFGQKWGKEREEWQGMVEVWVYG